MLCPSCNRPYLHIATLLNPNRLIYVHREVGKRDEEGNRKPVEFCMSRHGVSRIGKAVTIPVDNIIDGDVIYQADGYEPSPNQPNTKLEKEEKEENKTMPFKGFDKAVLQEKYPSSFGRRATEPSVSVQGNAHIQFNVVASKAFENCLYAIPYFEPESNRLRFQGVTEIPKGKENTVWNLTWPKEGSKNKAKSAGLAATWLLKEIGYDFKVAGNQTFKVDKLDVDKHVIIFTVPKETPKPKPVNKRTPKVAKTTAATAGSTTPATGTAASPAVNGADKPAEDDLVVDE